MQCPACHRDLTEMNAGSITVDACADGCGGIWFDAFEMQKVDEPVEAGGEALLKIHRDPAATVDMEQRRNCPRCDSIVMLRHAHKNNARVIVDECPGCGGFWLDAGELGMIRRSFDEVNEKRRQTEALLEELKNQAMAGLPRTDPGRRSRTLSGITGLLQ